MCVQQTLSWTGLQAGKLWGGKGGQDVDRGTGQTGIVLVFRESTNVHLLVNLDSALCALH